MSESLWIVGFIVVLAVTIASCPVRRDGRKEKAMSAEQAVKLLTELKPPLESMARRDYRVYVTSWLEGLDWDALRALCAFLRADISTVVTRIMNWQYNRARAGIDLARKCEIPSTKSETSTKLE